MEDNLHWNNLCSIRAPSLCCLLAYQKGVLFLIDFMEQSAWETNSCWVGLRNFLSFMEPEGSLSCWQEPATGPYPEPFECSPCIYLVSLRWILTLFPISHLRLGHHSSFFPLGFLIIFYTFLILTMLINVPSISLFVGHHNHVFTACRPICFELVYQC
jgi:hypothetical protein